MCSFAICISSLERGLLRSLDHFSVGLLILLLSFKSSFYILDNNNVAGMLLQIFSPGLWLVFLILLTVT